MTDAILAFIREHPFIFLALFMCGPVALVLIIEILKGGGAAIASIHSSSSGWRPHSDDDGQCGGGDD